MKTVPDHIPKPDYAITGEPLSERMMRNTIPVMKTPEQIEGMKKVCRVLFILIFLITKIAREVLDIAGAAAKPGVTTGAFPIFFVHFHRRD